MGAPKGQAGVSAGIPVDLLTLGLMQASVLGVPDAGMIYGLLLRAIQSFLDDLPDFGVKTTFTAFAALKGDFLYRLFLSGNMGLLEGFTDATASESHPQNVVQPGQLSGSQVDLKS